MLYVALLNATCNTIMFMCGCTILVALVDERMNEWMNRSMHQCINAWIIVLQVRRNHDAR